MRGGTGRPSSEMLRRLLFGLSVVFGAGFEARSCTRMTLYLLPPGRSRAWDRVLGSWLMYGLWTRSEALTGGGRYAEEVGFWAVPRAALYDVLKGGGPLLRTVGVLLGTAGV